MVERIEINLLPAEYRVHRRQLGVNRQALYSILGVGVLLLILIVVTTTYERQISDLQSKISMVEGDIARNSHVQKEINTLRSEKSLIEGKIRALQRIDVNREKWVRLLEVFSRYLPEYSWLVSMQELEGEKPVLEMEGRTYSIPDVADYMAELKQSPYIAKVDLSNIEQVDERQQVFRFRINCEINPDAGLNDE
jgi:Tfp pilus assembly protein PilN